MSENNYQVQSYYVQSLDEIIADDWVPGIPLKSKKGNICYYAESWHLMQEFYAPVIIELDGEKVNVYVGTESHKKDIKNSSFYDLKKALNIQSNYKRSFSLGKFSILTGWDYTDFRVELTAAIRPAYFWELDNLENEPDEGWPIPKEL